MKKLLSFFFLTLAMQALAQTGIRITSLEVEGRKDLLGLDLLQPRLSWKILSEERGVMQTAYEIMVASSLANLRAGKGNIWSTGLQKSDASINVVYKGIPLQSYHYYYWKVRVHTTKGVSAWSEPAKWSMGILNQTEWQARWIGLDTFNRNDRPHDDYTRLAARYIRKNIAAPKEVTRATAYISGLGLYELYINGQKVGDDVLAPTVKEYNKVVPYNTLDVTSYLKKGKNAIGVILGNGRFFTMRDYRGEKKWRTGIPPVTSYGYPKLLMQIRMEYRDGTTALIGTDGTWRVTDNGPILANNEFDGEEYDANKELKDWAQPWFNDQQWRNVDLVAQPASRVESQLNENIKVKEVLTPISIHQTTRGTYILDMGQNMVGWLKVAVKGNKGDTLKMVFAETLKNSDSLYLANIRNARVTDKYIFKGAAKEAWEPRFAYHGFRFVEVSGLKYRPALGDFEGKVIYDDIRTTGTFISSNKTLNDVYKNAFWTIRGNYRGMPTDCPQRDERMGWLGDRSVNSYGESFLFDNSRLYAKWIDDIADAQTAEGSIPDVAPTYWKMYNDNVTWPSSFIIIPEMLRKQFGDSVTFRKHYPAMKKWITYMWSKYRTGDLILRDNYGDWCLPPESLDLIHSKDSTRNTKGALLAAAYFYYSLNLMKGYAAALGSREDQDFFQQIADRVKTAFNKEFYNSNNASYANNTVTSNLLPLTFGLAPEEKRNEIFEKIIHRTHDMYNDHVSTGLVGAQWLMRGLSDHGRPDLAYKIATNTTYPSWGYMISQGATTIWELWNGNTANPAMNSGNHVMLLGDLLVWYFEYLAGIKSDVNAVAFKKIIMHPVFPEGLEWVNADYESKYGVIKSHWKRKKTGLEWEIAIPANTTAVVNLPVADVNKVREGGKMLAVSGGIRNIHTQGDKTRVEIGSGKYRFTINQ